MKKATPLFSAIALLIVISISSPSFGQMKMENKKVVSTSSTVTLKTNIRKLWEDHITWTRNVILCLVDGLPGTDQAVKRLLQNQVDIGNVIKPYYGEAAGNKLTELLKEHITISAEVVNSAKAGNTSVLDVANKKWYANADEISDFLCKANPKWALADMKMMMNDHLKLTTNEAVQRIKKDYDADVVAYDKVHDEILKMSDMLAEGIVKQFPEKFKTGANMKSSK
jgi:hypothetical protein